MAGRAEREEPARKCVGLEECSVETDFTEKEVPVRK
jgi:hypothetical protein